MTVGELKKELDKFQDDLEVWMQYETHGRNGIDRVIFEPCEEQDNDVDHCLLGSNW